MIDADELARVKSVKAVRGERLLRGRALAPGELGALMGACADDETAAGIRDGALIALLYATGLRRAEVVALAAGDYNAEPGELRVRGKGNKERNVWIDNGAFDALADWLNLRGSEPGALFVPITKGGKLGRGGMTAQAVYKMLRKRGLQAGVKRFSPHDLRRSFISDQLDAGTDVVTVQAMAGHASPSTTAKYDRRGDRAKQRAARALCRNIASTNRAEEVAIVMQGKVTYRTKSLGMNGYVGSYANLRKAAPTALQRLMSSGSFRTAMADTGLL
jgi:site-specific recombinase XerD